VSMVKSLASQFGPSGVTINNLAPGAILTGRNEEVLKNEEIPPGYKHLVKVYYRLIKPREGK
ncbi:MAG: hypothetical protein PF689_03215, partial [Deltaproteobacteria bacterium]|nr:hypothetical protein [Deltaproteobacteria bacterium]